MTGLFFSFLLAVVADGEAKALRSALEAGEPDFERVQSTLDSAVTAAAVDALPVIAEQLAKQYELLREKGGEVAGIEQSVAYLEAKDQELRNARKGAIRADVVEDYKLKLRREGARRTGLERCVAVLDEGFPKLLAAVSAKGDPKAMEQFLGAYEVVSKREIVLDGEDEKIKGALAAAEFEVRKADKDNIERMVPLIEEKAKQSYLLDLLEKEVKSHQEARDGVIRSLSSLLENLPSAARSDAEKQITTKVDKRASDEERAVYVDLFAGLGKTEGPKEVQKLYQAADRNLDKSSEDMDKLRERYTKTREGFFGAIKDQKPNKDGMIMINTRLKEAMEQAEKELREAGEQRRNLERVHRNACAALAIAVRSLPEGTDKERQLSWLFEQASGEKSVQSRAWVVQGLGRYDRPEVREHLRSQVAEEKDARVQVAAVSAITHLADAEALPVLREKLLKDEDWRVRAAAIEAMRKIPDNASVPALIEVLGNEPGRLREDANRALQNLTGKTFTWEVATWKDWWALEGATFDVAEVQRRRQLALAAEDDGSKGVSFYGITSTTSKVCFVLDISGSMAEPNEGEDAGTGGTAANARTKIETAVAELKAAITPLKDSDDFNVVLFSEEAMRWKPKMTSATQKNKDAVFAWIDENVVPLGGTNIYAGMMDAFDMAGVLDERKTGTTEPVVDTIFFLSDGDPSIGEIVDPDELRTTLRELNEFHQVRINAIGVGKGANATFLYGLAEDSGGSFVKR